MKGTQLQKLIGVPGAVSLQERASHKLNLLGRINPCTVLKIVCAGQSRVTRSQALVRLDHNGQETWVGFAYLDTIEDAKRKEQELCERVETLFGKVD